MNVARLSMVAATVLLMSGCTSKQEQRSDHPGFVNKDTANVMIESYLKSIAPDTSATTAPELHSLIMDAAELRTYLNQNEDMKDVKFMFAHTLDYIHAGNAGKPAGLRSDALTIIVAGYDRQGNYIFAPGNMVANHCAPCPEYCPKAGAAAGNLLR